MLSYCSAPPGSANMESRLLEGAFAHGYNGVAGLHALSRFGSHYHHLSMSGSPPFSYADYATGAPPGVLTPVSGGGLSHPAFSMEGLLSRQQAVNGASTISSPGGNVSSPGSAHSGKSGKCPQLIIHTIID